MRVWLWNVPVDVVDLSNAVSRVQSFIAGGHTTVVTTPNSEILYRSRCDSDLRAALAHADLSIPDGIGVVLALRMLGGIRADRTPGADLVTSLLMLDNHLPVYLLGAKQGVVEEAAKRLLQRGVNVVGSHHGYFTSQDDSQVLGDIVDSGASLLLAGMGSPRQEIWLHRHRGQLPGVCAIAVGGTIDLLAGRVRRAPGWCQKVGMEWCYRIIADPSRWRRGIVLGQFGMRVVGDRLVGNRIVIDDKG